MIFQEHPRKHSSGWSNFKVLFKLMTYCSFQLSIVHLLFLWTQLSWLTSVCVCGVVCAAGDEALSFLPKNTQSSGDQGIFTPLLKMKLLIWVCVFMFHGQCQLLGTNPFFFSFFVWRSWCSRISTELRAGSWVLILVLSQVSYVTLDK